MGTIIGIVLIVFAIFTFMNLEKDAPMKDKDMYSFDEVEKSRKYWEEKIRRAHRDNSIEVHTFVFGGAVGNNWCLLNTGFYVFTGNGGEVGQYWFFPYEDVLGYEIIQNGYGDTFWKCCFKLRNANGEVNVYDYALPVYRVAQVEDDIRVSLNRYKKGEV